MIRWIVALAVGLAFVNPAAPAWAQGDGVRLLDVTQPAGQEEATPDPLPLLRPGQGGQQRPLSLLAAGDALPLKQVLACLRNDYPGQVLDAQVVERDGQPFYRIKLLGADGKVQVLLVDGRTCAVVEKR